MRGGEIMVVKKSGENEGRMGDNEGRRRMMEKMKKNEKNEGG